MPRQAAASKPFAVDGSTREFLTPPADLNELERAEFVSLVLGASPNHFVPSDVPLLAAYARTIVEERVAAGELAAAYVVDGKPSPWLPIWQGKARALTTLARMLALNPAGRVPSKSATGREPEAVSYYDRQHLTDGSRDDAPN